MRVGERRVRKTGLLTKQPPLALPTVQGHLRAALHALCRMKTVVLHSAHVFSHLAASGAFLTGRAGPEAQWF